MSQPTKTSPTDGGDPTRAKREEGQATLSAIGDVSVAATEAVGRVSAAPGRMRWLSLLLFFLLVYIGGCGVAIYTLKSAPWVQAFVAPLPAVLMAVLVFWRRQVWKFRARAWKYRETVQQDALNSLAHESANALNAMRANMTGFSEAESLLAAAEHLKQVERALARLDAALGKATGQKTLRAALGSVSASPTTKSDAA